MIPEIIWVSPVNFVSFHFGPVDLKIDPEHSMIGSLHHKQL